MTKLTLDINATCNEQCRFCYQKLDGSSLSEETIMDLVDSTDARVVEIGGGEPFLDERIVRILSQIRNRDKKAHVSTNATTIPRGLLRLEQRVREGIQIQASLHAANQKLYEHITGKDLFRDAICGIITLKEYFPTQITSAIYQDNLADVPNLVNLAKRLNLPLRINLVFPIGNGKNVKLLTPMQIDQLRGYLLAEKVTGGDKIDSPLIHTNNCHALQNFYGLTQEGICPIDCGKMYVSPRGERSSCEFYNSQIALATKAGETK